MRHLLLLIITCCVFKLCAEEFTVQNRQELRCIQLLPNQPFPLAVDFAIPDDFVAMTRSGKFDPKKAIYWGRPDVLARYFENPNSLSEPIIKAEICFGLLQRDLKDGVLITLGSKLVSDRFLSWGIYLVKEAKTKKNKEIFYKAWVGLNSPNDKVMQFELINPKNQKPQQGLALWRTFLDETKPLPFQQFLLAYGQDLHLGSTTITCNLANNTARIEAIAERRKNDNLLKVGLKPLNDNLSIEHLGLAEGNIEGTTFDGMPLVKIYCNVKEQLNEKANEFVHTIPVVIKEVDEFSFSKNDPEIAWNCELGS